MSSTIEYHVSVTPEPYEPAPTPEDIWPEDLEAFYDEQDAVEKAREDAAEAHEAWKAQKQKEEKRRALELEWREKKLGQERKVAEAKARKEREEREAAEKKRQEEAEAKARAEAAAAEQQRLEEEARAKALVEASKATEVEKEKEDGNEGSKVGSRSDGDDEREKDPKGKALKKLVKQRKDRKGKGKATDSEAADVLRKRKIKSSAVVVSGEEEVVGPSGRPLKKLKTEPEMQADDEEYKGNERCGRCKTDNIRCFICRGHTCERCKLKKNKCVFPQGESLGSAGSSEVIDLLQKLCDKMDDFQEGLERVEGKVDFLGSRVNDLVDDFHEGDAPEWPSDFVEEEFREEWAASKVELGNLKNVNSEALQIAMRMRLDKDVAQLWNAHVTGTETLDAADPFEVTNMQVWYGCLGKDGLRLAIKRRDHFLDTRDQFYALGGHRIEWALWKRYLEDADKFLVEDSEGELDPEEKKRDEMC
ncbi:uncharacterized protein EV420DRAFT_1653606 [Desarmillaria tabescens]|uniref:Uncharacterized protein n=1 Tax=Armillaria tabescens TaxID=1929756 RepID=A0AA39MHX8_ARMTA|nr:uncharacterized protein EV420DRAFT_1653606 [Desarmillaria tabescens]KAK0434987.1 hypothetical protein EV420DRAFT_1653606 [Desarmillaria tabescens]